MSEIAYAINSQATINQGSLVLDLMEASKEGHAYRLCSPSEGYSILKWRSLASQLSDKEAFTFLLKEELQSQKKKSGKSVFPDCMLLKQLHIPSSQILQALTLLAPTQKVFCQGKQLVFDLYGKSEFYYAATPLKNGQLQVEGRLRWRDTDIALNECTAIGHGTPLHWFVHGITLKFIHTSVTWKELQPFIQHALHLEGRAKQVFLDDLQSEEGEAPLLVMKEGSIEEAMQSFTPYPVLKLKDRWGACADLWMDYGEGGLIDFEDSRANITNEAGRSLFKRQRDAELNWEKDLLETDFIKKVVGTSHYYCPMDRIAKSLTFLLEIGWKIQDVQERTVMKQTGCELRLEEKREIIEVKGHLRYDSFEADIKQIMGAFNRREHFIQLSVNTVGLLSFDGPQQGLQELAQDHDWIAGEVQIKKNRFGALDKLWEYSRMTPSLQELKDRWQNFTGIEEALPSSDFCGVLRPYQQQGVNWIAFLKQYGFHGILADEMGLGKTVQVLAFLSRHPRKTIEKKPHLIVMPTSLLFNWRNEIHQFLPDWSSIAHQGAQRTRSSEDLKQADIILTSYTTLRLDLPLFQSIHYASVILDEGQMIKNANTQTAQAVCEITGDLRLSLTGTPVENHLQEMWSHFHFLMPDLLGSKEQFDAEIQAAQSDRRYLERIQKKTAPFLLRRRKTDVAPDLPPRLEHIVWIEMSEKERLLYDQLLAGFKSGLLKKVERDGMGQHRLEVLEAILRLRQMCCHPLLVSSLTQETIGTSAKFENLLEDLATLREEGHKVLVYSQFTSMLHLMTQAAHARGWSYCYLDGNTKNREEVVTRFQEDPSQLIFFISLKAGGVGLNLTAADYVYLYDPWWNEAVEEQAINRAHRIGRQQAVITKRLVIAESIEEKIMRLKANKRLMIDNLFESESSPAPLTIEDLQFLLT